MAESIHHTVYWTETGKIFSWGFSIPTPMDGQDWIDGQWDGSLYQVDLQTKTPVERVPDPVDLTKIKTEAISTINSTISAIRSNYITISPGQEMHYLEKRDQANRCIQDANPTDEAYPLLASEVGITSDTLLGVANVVLQRYQMFVDIESRLNRIRMTASASIKSATTEGEVSSAMTTFRQSLAQEGFIQ